MGIKSINNRVDRRIRTLLFFPVIGTASLLVLIVFFLLYESWPFLANSWVNGTFLELFQHQGWYPLEGQFNMLPMILSSLAVTVGAVVLALPLGLGCAIFLQFYSTPPWTKSFRLLLNVLAGIPSVVFGLWGLTRLVPIIAMWQPPGTSLLAAILVLSLMILPTIALTSTSALAAVPKALLTGGMALGLRRSTQILQIHLPAAQAGIISGVLLATARALGETMALLMVAGNVVQNPSGLFVPVRVITANIALEMAYAMGDHRASLFTSGLLLTLLIGLISWLAFWVRGRLSGAYRHG
jgi:phosphate transport system permease protein